MREIRSVQLAATGAMLRRYASIAAVVAFGLLWPLSHALGTDLERLRLARLACSGRFAATGPVVVALNYDPPPIYFFFHEQVRPAPILVISAHYCPDVRDDAEFIVGHVLDNNHEGLGRYYKISVQGGGIIEAARSHVDSIKHMVVYDRIDPISQSGSTKIYPEFIQDDFKALLANVIAKWGR
jgi:hypothetical protein